MILIDTDVLVECLRGSQTARTWLGTLRNDAFSIPGVVAMELLMGLPKSNRPPTDKRVPRFIQRDLARRIRVRAGLLHSVDASSILGPRHPGLPYRRHGPFPGSASLHIQSQALSGCSRLGRPTALHSSLAQRIIAVNARKTPALRVSFTTARESLPCKTRSADSIDGRPTPQTDSDCATNPAPLLIGEYFLCSHDREIKRTGGSASLSAVFPGVVAMLQPSA